MAQEPEAESQRLIRHTVASVGDLALIEASNAQTYSPAHAERYLDFLEAEIEKIAQNPERGALVEQRPSIRFQMVRSTQRRSAHGYRVFYEEIEGGIEIKRILHTAMDWAAQFGPEA